MKTVIGNVSVEANNEMEAGALERRPHGTGPVRKVTSACVNKLARRRLSSADDDYRRILASATTARSFERRREVTSWILERTTSVGRQIQPFRSGVLPRDAVVGRHAAPRRNWGEENFRGASPK